MAKIKLAQGHILDLLKLDYLPIEDKAALLDQMVDLINQRIFLRVGQVLEVNKRDEFVKLLNGNNEEAVQIFLASHVPNFLNIVDEETIKLREEMIKKFTK